ncbi:gamma-glutamylcyclotransferase family protein [Clostridium mediterraneense]|uniref:gamma-glutamylcyclotransferase family protein n=1 Tax=Clostridium mediterraneense TaxID=1805472 RepID=UPI0008376BE3|nr:gamma-glutamylcyclotransferase family protein [Clostridium mediterraneense]
MNRNNDKIKRFFVYGSLREGFFNYDKYLKGNVLTNEIATTKGELYHMKHKGYPALIDGDRDIEGEVITVNNPDEITKALDEMEGFFGVSNPKNEYERIEKEVRLSDGSTELCYVYKYVEEDVNNFDDNYIYLNENSWKEYMLSR